MQRRLGDSCVILLQAMIVVTLDAKFFDEYVLTAPTDRLESSVLLKHLLATFRTAKIRSLSWELDIDSSCLKATILDEGGA